MARMKGLIAFVFLLVLFNVVGVWAAPALDIEKIDKGSVLIAELKDPAKFEFVIRNRGEDDTFQIYSLVGVSMTPRGTFDISTGKKSIDVQAMPNEEIRKVQRGIFSFEYQIKGQKSGIFKDTLSIKIISLKDVVDVSVRDISPDDENVEIVIRNLNKLDLEDMKLKITSEFFDFEDTVFFIPLEEKVYNVSLKKDKMVGLIAGVYEFDVEMEFKKISSDKKGEFRYLEEEDVGFESSSGGFLVRKVRVEKKNEGNVAVRADIRLRRDVLTRLFTTYAVEASSSEREGLFVNYVWKRDLGPGESLVVDGTTNYSFPFILLVLIIVIGFMARRFYLTDVLFRKRVEFVKTRGGEFALKVVLRVKARKRVEGVKISDTLPGMTKLFEGYGRAPDKVDEERRKLFWDIDKLNAGEERVFSYIVYSKLRVVGRFELPSALAVFGRGGEARMVKSNKTYFMSEAIGSE
jgi:hypothetical protein